MLTQQECILTHLLKCGTYDLAMLEDINYDLNDILDYLIENENLSLNNIFIEVFLKGQNDLKQCLFERKEELQEEINEELLNYIDEQLNNNRDLKEIDEEEEYLELKKDYELIKSGQLNPQEDIDWYTNCIDTHISIKHLYFYKKWLSKELEEIEDNMGFRFEERNY